MTGNLEQRLYRLEAQIAAIQQQIAGILAALAKLAQQQYGTGSNGGGGGGGAIAFCQLAASLGPATGTWPSIAPTTATGVTIYTPSSSGLAAGSSTVTVYNFRNVTWATGKTTYLAQGSDGSWCVIDQDC